MPRHAHRLAPAEHGDSSGDQGEEEGRQGPSRWRANELERVEAELGRSPNGIEPRPQRCCAEGQQRIEGSIAPTGTMERVKGIEPSS